MKKIFLLLVLFIASLSSMAQYYVPKHIPYNSHRKYYGGTIHKTYNNDLKPSYCSDEKDYKNVYAGFGVGINFTDNEEFNKKTSVIVLEGVIYNFIAEIQICNLNKNTELTNHDISFSWKLGYAIPVFRYNKGVIGVGPLIGKSYIQENESNNAYDKYDTYWYIYDHVTYEEPKYKKWEFGGVVMFRYGTAYTTLKITSKTIGFSIGFCQ